MTAAPACLRVDCHNYGAPLGECPPEHGDMAWHRHSPVGEVMFVNTEGRAVHECACRRLIVPSADGGWARQRATKAARVLQAEEDRVTAAPTPATTGTARRPLTVTVLGDPAPQGSKRHVGGGRMIESSKALGPWRDNVAWRVREAMGEQGWTTLDGPCTVALTFRLRRPASAPKSRVWPDRKPDIDKLERAILDALTVAGAIADDARVIELHSMKSYATDANPVGVTIGVEPLRGARPDDKEPA